MLAITSLLAGLMLGPLMNSFSITELRASMFLRPPGLPGAGYAEVQAHFRLRQYRAGAFGTGRGVVFRCHINSTSSRSRSHL